MAEAVQTPPWLLAVRRSLTPSPEAAYAIRFGVGASAAIWIGKAPGLVENHSSWILITVLMLTQPTTGASLLKGLLRLAGTATAVFTAILLFGLFSQDPPLLMAGLFLVQAVAAYGFTGRRFQYAWFVWAFTTAIVLGNAMGGEDAVEDVAFRRGSMVAMGIVLVFVVDSLLWPQHAEPSLRRSLASRARRLGARLRRAIAAPVDGPAGVAPEPDPAPESLARQLALAGGARAELGVSGSTVDALQRLAMLLEGLASRARILALPMGWPEATDAAKRALADLARHVEAALTEVAAAVTAGRTPEPFAEGLERALLALEGERDAHQQRVGWSRALESRVADLRDLVAVLRVVEATLTSRDETGPAGPSRSLLAFRPDPFRTKIALRAGIAVVLSFLVPLVLGWPLNTMVAPIAFMVAAAATRGAATAAAVVTFGVVAAGWLCADLFIIYFTSEAGRAPFALAAAFAIGTTFAFVGARRPQLATLPTFGGLVALLSIYGATAAPTDVYGSYNTVCYMGTALVVGFVVNRALWPATASDLFRQRIAGQLQQCLEAVRSAQQRGEAGRGERMRELDRAFAADAAQLGPLDQQAAHEPVERGLDAPRRTALLALATDLGDAVVADHPFVAEPLLERAGPEHAPLLDVLRREDEALVDSMEAAVATLRDDAPPRASGLGAAHEAVEAELRDRAARGVRIAGVTDEERRRFLVERDARSRLVQRQLAIERWLADWWGARE
ncbi:MAG: FUSC family protein [Myxococcota bacterium]|nr:FUSC family protein [Myxococcota bacterium]